MKNISRITALTGALALSGTALLGGMTAQAAPIDGTQDGSIIVHKHVEDPASTDGNPAGAPLKGVEFSAQQVLVDPDGSAGPATAGPIDMTKAEGWKLAEQVFTSTAPALPAGDAVNGPVFSLAAAAVQSTNASGIATFSGLDLGAYLVTETAPGDNLIAQAAAPFWVSVPMPTGDATEWNYNVDVFPKNTLNDFTPTKAVTDNDLIDPDGNVEWTVSTPIPASNLAYQSFSLSDPVATGLNFQSFGNVTLNGTVLVRDDQTATPPVNGDYTVSGTTITFTAAGLAKVNAITMDPNSVGATVAVVVNTDIAAIPATGGITNTATVTLNGIAKPASATTNWGELLLNKTTSEDGSALGGATFELYAANKSTLIATGTTAADGTLQFDVWVGNDTDVTENFWLKETVAPAGHVLPADPWTEVTVNAGQAATATVTIENHLAQGPNLPMTGGTGAALLTLAGVVVLSIALVPMVRRRKAQSAA